MHESTDITNNEAPQPRRLRLNAESAGRLVTAWEQSGLSAEAFCRDQTVTAKTLFRWRARLRSETGLSRVVVATPGANDQRTDDCLRVVGPHGVSVEVPVLCDEEILRRACRALSC